MVMYDLEQRIIALESRMNQMVRVGTVSIIDPSAGTARVILQDSGEMVSYDLPVLFQKTQNDKFYTMPDIGEQVLCLFLFFRAGERFYSRVFFFKSGLRAGQ